jgi:hypothetical protein
MDLSALSKFFLFGKGGVVRAFDVRFSSTSPSRRIASHRVFHQAPNSQFMTSCR